MELLKTGKVQELRSPSRKVTCIAYRDASDFVGIIVILGWKLDSQCKVVSQLKNQRPSIVTRSAEDLKMTLKKYRNINDVFESHLYY
jgi:hypothetical protein